MDSHVLEKHFASIGARVKMRRLTRPRWIPLEPSDYTLDIGNDRKVSSSMSPGPAMRRLTSPC